MKLLIVISITLFAFSSFAKTVSIMAYNVENLFDTIHDEGKEDYTYLPLKEKQSNPIIQNYCYSMYSESYRRNCFELDWNENTLKAKIKNLAKVILSYNNGEGADIIAFEEVENKRVLQQLIDIGLQGKGYKYISLIEGPDTRGIDVAMISKFPIVKEKLHKVDISKIQTKRITRGILEVTFKIGRKHMTVLGNHWPSQGNNDLTRLKASEVLKKAVQSINSSLVVAVGDFNQTDSDKPHGIKQNILPLFVDVEDIGRSRAMESSPGTHWYRGEWQSLDRIFVLKKSLESKSNYIDYSSFEIINKNFMVTDLEWVDFDTGAVNIDENIPMRFNAKSLQGYSDHLPVAIKINI